VSGLAQYKLKWLNNISKMEGITYPKTTLSTYRKKAWTSVRLLDGYNREAGTGHLLD